MGQECCSLTIHRTIPSLYRGRPRRRIDWTDRSRLTKASAPSRVWSYVCKAARITACLERRAVRVSDVMSEYSLRFFEYSTSFRTPREGRLNCPLSRRQICGCEMPVRSANIDEWMPGRSRSPARRRFASSVSALQSPFIALIYLYTMHYLHIHILMQPRA